MPVSRFRLNLAFSLFALLLGAQTLAAEPSAPRPIHWSGDKTRILRRENQVELEGHAAVHQPGESLSADYILLDLNERTLHARGNCVYVTAETVMQGEEMRFNLDTRTGTIVGGRVSNAAFTLTGERINKLGDRRFQTHRGEYTTCRDCPGAWSLRADDVDLEFEGYAHMKGVTPTIKDSPLFWLPYFVVPLKTKRQSGFLFPEVGFTERGFRYVVPFYWAVSRSTDMTFGLGNYGGHGTRAEWEGRYRLRGRSGGVGNFYYLDDRNFYRLLERKNAPELRRGRVAVSVSQLQMLPGSIEQKLRLVDTSDNLYLATFDDIKGLRYEAYLASDLIFSGASDEVSGYVAARRFRNLLYLDSSLDFDPNTVQVYPTTALTTNDRSLLGSLDLRGGVNVGFTNFSRAAGTFDVNPITADRLELGCTDSNELCSGRDAIREGSRISVTPSIYRPFRPWDRVSLVPSFEYRAFFYDFKDNIPNLARGYALTRVDLSTRLERVFETGNPNSPLMKHVIRPQLSYSLIPFVNEDANHPFLRQIDYARRNSIPNWYFDNSDIVPINQTQTYSNYFTPLGNSLTYGFTTQLIRRDSPLDVEDWRYHRALEWRASQSFNFNELDKEKPEPLSRISTALLLDLAGFRSQLDYIYQPYVPVAPDRRRHVLSANLTYVFAQASQPGFMGYERSIGMSYFYNKLDRSPVDNISLRGVFSLNDYLQPAAGISYNLIKKEITEFGGSMRYQSPSRCWGVLIGASVSQCPGENGEVGYCVKNPKVNLQVNITGAGLEGISQLTSANRPR